MRIFPILMAALVIPEPTRAMPAGIGEWYDTIQDFMGTLHEVLQVGAEKVSEFDAASAEKVRDLEYNWLSLIGYYKGITPLISDFFFNYHEKEDFENRNDGLVDSLNGLIHSFAANENEGAVCKRLETLLDSTLRKDLFADGAIRLFLQDLDGLVNSRKACLVVIREARSRRTHISDFLYFITRGAKKPSQNGTTRKDSVNSEL